MAYPDYKDQIQIAREQARRYYLRSGYSGTNIIDILTNNRTIMEGTLRYIGTKIIDAKPMNIGDYNAYRGWKLPADEDPDRWGFLVIYPDGYESWSPGEAFNEAYRVTDNMNFGLALEAMKKGLKVARRGWNGKNMFIYIQPGSEITSEQARNPVLKETADEQDSGAVEILPHIDMWTVNSSGRRAVCVGWLASQTDMLSDDWEIVE